MTPGQEDYFREQGRRYRIFYKWSFISWIFTLVFVLLVKNYFQDNLLLRALQVWSTVFILVAIPLIILFSFPLRWFDRWSEKKRKN